MTETILDKLRHELGETQKRRHRLGILKISFVTALLGFGSVRIEQFASFYPVLYLVPLVAVFFDLLVMGEHFSIRRLGAFLRLHSTDELEREWEGFVAKNRDRFFKNGSLGFTILSFVAAIAFLTRTQGSLGVREWSWFIVVFILFWAIIIWGNTRLKGLDELRESEPTAEAPKNRNEP